MKQKHHSEAVSSESYFISTAPFDPHSVEQLTLEQERYFSASSWLMIWRKFRCHRLAMISLVLLLLMYSSILVSEWLAPYGLNSRHTDFLKAPPQTISLFHEGRFIGPFVYSYQAVLDRERLAWEYPVDYKTPQPIRFFCRSETYDFWGGVFKSDWHLFCPAVGGTLFLFGTDRLGRDMLSRILYGARVSLTVGLIGILISFGLGILLGGLAGYYGGMVDALIQRLIEVIRSLPELPLWMALSAALPVTWSPILIYFGITIILGLVDWTGLARAVRSKLLALREEDFTLAAQLMGASPRRVIFRHLMPNFMSHLIASATLAIPSMILGETALSFLGIGLRPPITSWGVLLQEATNINAVVLTPWLLTPAIPVIILVLAFNFLGDGLRDAADPYR